MFKKCNRTKHKEKSGMPNRAPRVRVSVPFSHSVSEFIANPDCSAFQPTTVIGRVLPKKRKKYELPVPICSPQIQKHGCVPCS